MKGGEVMATNPPKNNSRKGAVRHRSQVFNPKTQRFVKRDTSTGKFMSVKKDGSKYKGIRQEKP